MLRCFPGHVEEFAPVWRDRVLTAFDWEEIAASGTVGGTYGSFWVRSGDWSGVAKPGRARLGNALVLDHPVAAHEKIASDLAFDLDLPVPPALLWDRRKPVGRELLVISAACFEPGYPWGQVARTSFAPKFVAALKERASAMCVFDTWLHNGDRLNDGNLVVGLDASTSTVRAAYIDFANALSLRWTTFKQPFSYKDPVALYPPGTPAELNIISAVTSKIEALAQATIEDVVRRIPVQFLPRAQAETIVKGLLYRRRELRNMMKQQFPGLT